MGLGNLPLTVRDTWLVSELHSFYFLLFETWFSLVLYGLGFENGLLQLYKSGVNQMQLEWFYSGCSSAVQSGWGWRGLLRGRISYHIDMTKWEYATIPLLTHNTKQILDTWGSEGWELVAVVPGPNGPENLVAYLKRPLEA